MKIINNTLEVPEADYWVFTKTPTIMKWLSAQGYEFTEQYPEELLLPIAAIVAGRESINLHTLFNPYMYYHHQVIDSNYVDITHLLENTVN